MRTTLQNYGLLLFRVSVQKKNIYYIYSHIIYTPRDFNLNYSTQFHFIDFKYFVSRITHSTTPIITFYANVNNEDQSYFSVIYSIILRDKKYGLSVNMIATKIMPTLIPHTMNPGLNLEQFQTLIEVLQDMLEQIDR